MARRGRIVLATLTAVAVSGGGTALAMQGGSSAPPASAPATSAPPVTSPPTSAPPTSAPPTSAPPVTSPPSSAPPTSAAPAATQPPAAPAATQPPATTAAVATPAGPATCTPAQLRLAVGGENDGMGHGRLVMTLTNTSGTACALDGYPGLQLQDTRGAAQPTTTVRGGDYTFPAVAPRQVVLSPGGVGSFDVGYDRIPQGSTSCSSGERLAVIPPNDTAQLVATVSITACPGGRLDVSPVVAGSSGVQ